MPLLQFIDVLPSTFKFKWTLSVGVAFEGVVSIDQSERKDHPSRIIVECDWLAR